MELWWWIEPMFCTSLVTFVVSGLLAVMMITFDVRGVAEQIGIVVCAILLVPLAVCIVSVIIQFFIWIFSQIWSPYF